jgi:hypothetical protein
LEAAAMIDPASGNGANALFSITAETTTLMMIRASACCVLALSPLVLFGPAAPAAEPSVATEMAQNKAVQCKAALGGNQEHAYRLAWRHLFGVGMARNPRTGVAWLRVAAALGHPEALRLMKHVPRGMGMGAPSCDGGFAGALTRGVAVPPAEVKAMVGRLAPQFGLDPALVLTVMQIESSFRSNIVSPKAAAGLMQLIPATAERFGVADVFDPEDNAKGGMKYLRWLLSYFRGDVILATAAYNAGEGAVDRHKGVPPYAETQNYVAMIRRLYGAERHPYDPAVTGPSPLVRAAENAEHKKSAAKGKG